MKINYTVIYTPKDIDEITKSDIRYVTIESDKRHTQKEVEKLAQREVVNTNTIDSYALRNYWEPAVCESQLVDTPWNKIEELSEYVVNKHNAKHNNKNISDMSTSVEFEFKNHQKAEKSKKDLISEFGSILPVDVNGVLLEIVLYKRTNLKTSDYDDIVKIFELYDEITN